MSNKAIEALIWVLIYGGMLVAGLGLDGTVIGQQALANQLAYLLPFSLEQKLALLALPQPTEQLALIQSLLDRLQGEMLA